MATLEERLRKVVKDYPDFPKKGILFKDMMPILLDADLTKATVAELVRRVRALPAQGPKVTAVVGLEARGFLLGPWVAAELGLKFVPIRKPGKLPGTTERVAYKKEYGEDVLELQAGALTEADGVVVLDDLLATGGTMGAALGLVGKTGASVRLCLLLIHLSQLPGAKALGDAPFQALLTY